MSDMTDCQTNELNMTVGQTVACLMFDHWSFSSQVERLKDSWLNLVCHSKGFNSSIHPSLFEYLGRSSSFLEKALHKLPI